MWRLTLLSGTEFPPEMDFATLETTDIQEVYTSSGYLGIQAHYTCEQKVSGSNRNLRKDEARSLTLLSTYCWPASSNSVLTDTFKLSADWVSK